MKLWLKLALCLLLVLFAAASLLAVLDDLGVLDRDSPAEDLAAGYALRSWEGRVAVFSPPGAEAPEAVTDVHLRTLPAADRLALARGLRVSDRESLARLLEDLGA